MSVWTNKNGTNSTSWSTNGDDNTNWSLDDDGNVTQSWNDNMGSIQSGDTSNVQSSIGTTSPSGSVMGTYDGAAAAATSLVGSKYHLFDNSEFFFGTDQDVRLSFDGDGSGMLIRVYPAASSEDILMTLRNGDTDVVKYKGDKSMQLSEASSLPSSPSEGSIIYHNNSLYLAR